MKKKVYKPRLINAKEMSIKYPDSFSYWEEDIAKIKVGDIVKVSNSWERFWTVITAIDGDNIVDEVNNLLMGNLFGKPPAYNLGDLIAFKRENIYEVWDGPINGKAQNKD